MNAMTEANLRHILARESEAQLKYKEFAHKAEEEGFGNIARLFQATSFAEQIHAGLVLRALRRVGSTSDNLAAAIQDESFEVQQVFPAYIEVANLQGESNARSTFEFVSTTERTQVNLYQEALSALGAGYDVELLGVFVCPDCGYIAKDQPPEKCPLSGTPGYQFKGF